VSTGGFYLALAYTVVLAIVLLYVGIIALKLGRMQSDILWLRDTQDEAGEPPHRREAA
jgi:hypothetical protein